MSPNIVGKFQSIYLQKKNRVNHTKYIIFEVVIQDFFQNLSSSIIFWWSFSQMSTKRGVYLPEPATPTVAAPAPMNLAAESMSLLTCIFYNQFKTKNWKLVHYFPSRLTYFLKRASGWNLEIGATKIEYLHTYIITNPVLLTLFLSMYRLYQPAIIASCIRNTLFVLVNIHETAF